MSDLCCAGVAKNFGGQLVLSGINLEVAAGNLTAILGASGSGKTTLLRLISGFLRPDAGTISVGERVLSQAPGIHLLPEARNIGYVAQDGALFPHLTVAENVAFGLPRAQRKSSSRITEMLEIVGMGSRYAARRPHELSGGEQRRVALARALAPAPKLVLLDEPFSDLDASLRVETRASVRAALRSVGATALLVTHDQGEALSMGDEVSVLLHGTLAQTAVPRLLYQQPKNLDVAQFVGEANILVGSLHGDRASCALGDLPLLNSPAIAEADAVAVMIRPEQIRFGANSEAGIAAEVKGITYYGAEAAVQLSLGESAGSIAIAARIPACDCPEVGDNVRLSVAGAVMAYPR